MPCLTPEEAKTLLGLTISTKTCDTKTKDLRHRIRRRQRSLRRGLLQCRHTLEDVRQEADLLERKLLLGKQVLLADVEAGLCLLLLQPTDAQKCVDVLYACGLCHLTKTCDSLRQGTAKLCLFQLLLC